MPDNNPVIFEDLPKEAQTTLRKSFAKETKNTKEGKSLIIGEIIMVVLIVIVAAYIIVMGYYDSIIYMAPFPIFFSVIVIAAREGMFIKWLEREKGIVRRRALKKKEKKSKQE